MIDKLLEEAELAGILVVEERDYHVIFKNNKLKGLYFDNIIALNNRAITTKTEWVCIFAEELGHHYTSYGNILDIKGIPSRKQEKRARNWGYEKLVPLQGLIQACEAGARNRYEIADFLNVTEEYIEESIKHYLEKYGQSKKIGNHIICFDPLRIFKTLE
ncbi:ImmA/IrrE family metallo-endopeptidase [Paenibacillus sp. NPDC093718]|uniref:ImmA/IrrE family metallo-endopeptidase n=1 Tax=Paenibacillus sp. NPDC093718 TaxID=3390601 RepID=UPI003CFDA3F6